MSTIIMNLKESLDKINIQMQAVLPLIQDETLFNSIRYKFVNSKFNILVDSFNNQTLACNDNHILNYYRLLLRYFKQDYVYYLCTKECNIIDTYELYEELNDGNYSYRDEIIDFIRKYPIKHWFFSYLCCCQNHVCLKNGDYEKCYTESEISPDTVEYLICEILEFMETFNDKQTRGSANHTEMPVRVERSSALRSTPRVPILKTINVLNNF